jgi:hypothetical protein
MISETTTPRESVKLPAIKRIEGHEGIYLVYAKEKDGTYDVARHVHDNCFEEVHSLHPTIDMLLTLPEEEFKERVSSFGPGINLYDPDQKPAIPITRQRDMLL